MKLVKRATDPGNKQQRGQPPKDEDPENINETIPKRI